MSANEEDSAAVVFTGEREVEFRERDRPEPAPDEVLIKTRRTLISTGTELTQLTHEVPEGSVWDEITDYPSVAPGYNSVGEVIEVGADVAADRLEERVATWSGHAAYSTATPEECYPVPEGVDDEEAAFFAMALIAMQGVRRGRVDWGEGVGVYGLGLVGQLASRFCHLAGARPVVGFDLAADRRAYVDREGVRTADPTEADPADLFREATGGRLAEVVFEATGNPEAIPGETEPLTEAGRLVLLSSPRGRTEFDFHDLCNAPSYEIIGAHQTSHPDYATPWNRFTQARHADLFFEYLEQEDLDVGGLVSHTYAPEEAADAYGMLLEDRMEALGVQFDWN
jgi:2-desacetyl-2-hydroxyethyl bacteriochlorophyllide A dehydrogenase